ncbi:hypothetical protein TWF173_001697 [Orbilia oligospora]|nr:hypothetical protein TWF173_001697 [Orbilia oligospora]
MTIYISSSCPREKNNSNIIKRKAYHTVENIFGRKSESGGIKREREKRYRKRKTKWYEKENANDSRNNTVTLKGKTKKRALQGQKKKNADVAPVDPMPVRGIIYKKGKGERKKGKEEGGMLYREIYMRQY